MPATRTRFGAAGVAIGIGALVLMGCASPGATESDAPAAPEDTDASATAAGDDAATPETAAAGSSAAEPAGEIDCTAVGETLIAWIEASFAGMSTEITNGELAAEYTVAADAHAATIAPDAAEWDVFGQVIDEYVAQWSALPADAPAIEHIETVEAHVDAFAESQGFDNDDFDDMTPIVGEACTDELEGLLEG